MAQSPSDSSESNNLSEIKPSDLNPNSLPLDLRPHYTFGLTLLKLMGLIAILGLTLVGLYEFCSGGTAG